MGQQMLERYESIISINIKPAKHGTQPVIVIKYITLNSICSDPEA